jgi:hypothetical protein
LLYCQLVFVTWFSQLYFCADLKHHSFHWRPWLQLDEKVKIFGYFTINSMVVLFVLGVNFLPSRLILLFGLELGNILGVPMFGCKGVSF